LIQAAVQAGVGKFILASSNAVLGEQPPPLHEGLVPAPLSPYGASKLAAEAYCSAAHGSYGIDVAILRFANVYGPFCTLKTSVVAKYLRLLEAQEPITIYGDGSQTRDFIYVDDVARAIMLALQKPAGCVTLQIGTGHETSIRELASLLIDLTNSPSTIEHTPPQRGEIHRNYASIERARKVLGFEPEWDLREGIQATIAWLDSASRASNVSG
jgi:UDP-glucose 4-epimerase